VKTNIDHALELCLDRKTASVVAAVKANSALLRTRDQFGDGLLDLAIATGNVQLVSALLSLGADATCPHPSNDIPLIAAIRSHSVSRAEIVLLLIHHGVDVNSPGLLDASAIHAAVGESSTELVDLLLRSGANINIRSVADDITPLWSACCAGDEKMVQLLLQRGANHRLRNSTVSSSPLDEAVRVGNATILTVLLEAGADPNSHGLGREPPLIHAILFSTPNALEIGRLLVHYGANCNAPGLHVASPLHAAVVASSLEFVELLLRCGARSNIQSPLDGLTPLQIAIQEGCKAIADRLSLHDSDGPGDSG
jgi:ankyrin repeat protein